MNDKQRQDPHDSLMDTQRLLLGAEPLEEGSFRLEDIMAEYGGVDPSAAAPTEPAEAAAPAKENTGASRGKTILFPSPAGMEPVEEEEDDSTALLQPDNDIDAISPEELFGLPVTEKKTYNLTENIPDEEEGAFPE